jgi:elongation factor 1 alpha-like protein
MYVFILLICAFHLYKEARFIIYLQVIIHYLSVNEPAIVTKLISILHKGSGEILKKKPRCLAKNSTALIQLTISRPVCMELYQDCRELGRFMLRSGGSTIAAGVVTKIL